MSEHRIYRYPHFIETPYKHIIRKGRIGIVMAEKAEPVKSDIRIDQSLSRSRRLIRDYILCNDFALFCTFTFDESKVTDRKDYKTIKSKLCKAFNNYKNRYDKNFKYMIVPELHKDGSVHFHGVITPPQGLCSPLKIPYRLPNGEIKMINNTKGYMYWPYYSKRFGFFSCSWIRNYTGCAIYVSKYMTKDLAGWFEKGSQIVMHSKGLNKPELVYCEPGGMIPGKPSEDDYNGDFCAVGMRDIWDTAPYFSHWADDFILYPDEIIDYKDMWKYNRWRDMPGSYDEFEQISMLARQYTGFYGN